MNVSRTSNKELRTSDVNLGIVCPMANEWSTAVKFVKAVLEQCKGFKSVKFFAIFDNACKDGSYDLLKGWRDKPTQLQLVWCRKINAL